MDWWNWLAPQAAPEYAAAVLMVVLAAVLIRIKPSDRANLAFGGFLLFRAAIMIFAVFGFFTVHPMETVFWDRMIFFFVGPLLFSAVMFASFYPRRRGPLGRSPRWAGALLVVLLVLGVAAFLEPDLARVYRLDAGGALSVAGHGPLFVFGGVLFLSYAVIAWVFARAYLDLPHGSRRRSLFLASLAFALTYVYDASGTVLGTSPNVTPPGVAVTQDLWFGVAGGVLLAGLVPLVAVAVLVVGNAWRTRDRQDLRDAGVLLAGLTLPLASNAVLAGWGSDAANIVNLGLWRSVFAGMVAYAILRHQLFGIELKVKHGIRHSVVASAFLGVFLLVSEGAEIVIASQLGTVVGLGAALLLAAAFRPLEGFAQRVADAAMPGVKPVAEMTHEDRLGIYREQFAIAWEDERVSEAERRMLDSVQERLDLAEEEVRRIEADVVDRAQ